jgi:nucleoside-diphosphate-sugar epimerase
MIKILITGASGFIGSFLVEEALKKGWEVWAGIRETSSRDVLTNSSLRFIDLNYAEANALERQIKQHAEAFGRWDYVIHSAGITKSASDADFGRINHLYTRNLVHALKNSGNTPNKFLYMSSLGAFGPGDEKHYTPLRAEDTPRPNSAYGRSKIKAERCLQSVPDFPYVILRPTGVYGPREKDYYVMVKMIHAGLDVSIGFKRQMLNFIYIKDLVTVSFSALESPLQNKVWFVADGDVYTSQEYTNIVQKALHKKRVLHITFPLFVVWIVSIFAGILCWMTGKPSLINPDKFRIMKQRNWTCDTSSLQKDLGFRAAYPLTKGMEETVAWYRVNNWL